jgi:hypothetical protein
MSMHGQKEKSLLPPVTPITRDIKESISQQARLREWLPFAIGAAVNFFLANCIISVLTA